MLPPWLQGLPRNANFLSAGAGTGAEIVTLGRVFPHWRFVAIDNSPNVLDACRQRICEIGLSDRVAYVGGRMQDYRSPSALDAASSIFVSHFIKDRDEKLAYFLALAENLSPGGVLIFADLFGERDSPDFVGLLSAWMALYASQGVSAEELERDRAHVERDIDFVPERELVSIINAAGFSNPLRFYQSYLFGAWVAQKNS